MSLKEEELAYLKEVLRVLKDSLTREQIEEERRRLKKYIADIQGRIRRVNQAVASDPE